MHLTQIVHFRGFGEMGETGFQRGPLGPCQALTAFRPLSLQRLSCPTEHIKLPRKPVTPAREFILARGTVSIFASMLATAELTPIPELASGRRQGSKPLTGRKRRSNLFS